VLIYFVKYRTARRKKSDVWTEAYSVILDGIQPGIVKKFGSKLKI